MTQLVNDDKIKVKSEETRISEKLMSSFRAQVTRLERELDNTTTELDNYQVLDGNVKSIVSGEVAVNLENPEHTRAVAYMKKHVRIQHSKNLSSWKNHIIKLIRTRNRPN